MRETAMLCEVGESRVNDSDRPIQQFTMKIPLFIRSHPFWQPDSLSQSLSQSNVLFLPFVGLSSLRTAHL